MLDHLAPIDASFLYLEDRATAMNSGSVLILETGSRSLRLEELTALVASHLEESPRYRQRVREVPFRLGGPVWVDDGAFELAYHVRRVALPAPGSPEQLAEFAARTLGRPLDRRHPLWELYLVDGLTHGRQALVTKSHQAIVDGRRSVDIAHLLLRENPREAAAVPEFAHHPEPGDLQLLAAAVKEYVETPAALARTFTGGARGLASGSLRAGRAVGGLLTSALRTTVDLAPESPLNSKIGDSRRLSLVRTDLDDYREIREWAARDWARGVTINDVVLTVVSGAIRAWLLSHGEPVHSRSRLRALVPVGVGVAEKAATTGLADHMMSCVIDLPIGEPRVTGRLRRISHDMRHQIGHGRPLSAVTLAELAGFAPPTLHHLGVRVAAAASKRVFNLVVSNAPGPRHPLHLGHAPVTATYPVTPLAAGQALSVGVTSYDGGVFYGLNGDRTVMADIEQLAAFVPEALAELTTEVRT